MLRRFLAAPFLALLLRSPALVQGSARDVVLPDLSGLPQVGPTKPLVHDSLVVTDVTHLDVAARMGRLSPTLPGIAECYPS